MQILQKWQVLVNEHFFELNEESIQDILIQFHELMSETELDNQQMLQIISSGSKQIMMPQLTKCTDLEIAQYTSLINQLVPNLASESVFIQSLSISFLPRLAICLTTGQLTDLLDNLLTALQVYVQSNTWLSAQCSIIAIYTIVTDILLKFESIHIQIPQIIIIFLKTLKQLQVSMDMYTDPTLTSTQQVAQEEQIEEDEKQKKENIQNILIIQSLLASIVVKIYKSSQLSQLSIADDVTLLTQIISQIVTSIKIFEIQNLQIYIVLMGLLCEENFIQCLIRCPNFVSMLISYCANILLQSQAVKVKNEARGFLTQLFVLEWFTNDEVAGILDALKLDLSEPTNRLLLKEMIESCFENYVDNYGVPPKAVVPLSVQV